jgi:flagellar hook-basal body complex protein FliE
MVAPIGGIGGGFSLGSLGSGGSAGASGGSSGTSFGDLLTKSISSLDSAQAQANAATQSVATGQSTDLSSVVMSVEQASLEVSLAAQVQTKAVEAYQSIFQTTI